MNTTKSVYNRLFKEDKVELGTHEVELASGFLAVLESKTKNLESIQGELSKITASFLDIRKNGTIKYKEAQNSAKELNSAIEQVKKMSNELGLNNKNIQELANAEKILGIYNRFTDKESKQYFN